MVDQDPPLDIQEGLYPVMKALITQKLLWHPNLDIRVFVASCLSEITRITAPDAPYYKAKMKEIFLVTRSALEKLYGASGNVVKKVVSILHNIAKIRSCWILKLVRRTEIPLREFPKIVSFICHAALEEDPLVTKEIVISDGQKMLKEVYRRSDKMAIKEGMPRQSSNKRSRKSNSMMRPEEGYTLSARSGEEKIEESNAKVSNRPLYIIKEYGEEQVGRKIRVWWPLNKPFSEGTISAFHHTSMMYTLLHDDGEEEILDLREERWEPIETMAP